MGEVQNGPEFRPESAAHFAEVGRELLARHFGATIDVDDLNALEDLDEVVLAELRTVDDPERPQDGHVPREALVLVGTLAGEVMHRGLGRDHGADTEWTVDESVSSTGVALAVTAPGGERMTINPVGESSKLFESGSSDGLAYMYETSVGVLENKL